MCRPCCSTCSAPSSTGAAASSTTSRRFGAEKGLKADWAAFTDDWRGLYQPAMEEVRSGRRAWTILDVLHRESLESCSPSTASRAQRGRQGSHQPRLASPEALARHRRGPDASQDPLHHRHALQRQRRPADAHGQESPACPGTWCWARRRRAPTSRCRRPISAAPQLLNLEPSQVMLVAAHNGDLAAAAATGLRTAFVARPTEYGPHQKHRLQGRPRLGRGRRQLHRRGRRDGLLSSGGTHGATVSSYR